MNSNSLIRVEGLTKQFGTVIANYNVSLDIKAGEIHSLLGENGAGKSTLMSMLSGIYSPDSGSIYVGEKLVTFKNPKDAIDLGIGMIYQHFKLVEVMSAKENIIAGQKGGLFVDSKGLTKEIGEISSKVQSRD
jgi:nucleoside ABC transporter ATP-binding protein